MKLGSAGDMMACEGPCRPAEEFRCYSEDKKSYGRVLSRGLIYSVFRVHGRQSDISLGRQLNRGEAKEAFTPPVPTWGQALVY